MSAPGAFIGIRPGFPQRWLIPARYRAQWQLARGRIVRRATDEEIAVAGELVRPMRLEPALKTVSVNSPSEGVTAVNVPAAVTSEEEVTQAQSEEPRKAKRKRGAE